MTVSDTNLVQVFGPFGSPLANASPVYANLLDLTTPSPPPWVTQGCTPAIGRSRNSRLQLRRIFETYAAKPGTPPGQFADNNSTQSSEIRQLRYRRRHLRRDVSPGRRPAGTLQAGPRGPYRTLTGRTRQHPGPGLPFVLERRHHLCRLRGRRGRRADHPRRLRTADHLELRLAGTRSRDSPSASRPSTSSWKTSTARPASCATASSPSKWCGTAPSTASKCAASLHATWDVGWHLRHRPRPHE